MKKWWILMMLVLVMSTPMTAYAVEKPFAQRECEREIEAIKGLYLKALQEETISEDLYSQVIMFLENSKDTLTAENAVDVYSDFPENYCCVLWQYVHDASNDIADTVWDLRNKPKIAAEYIEAYNAEMQYIEKELSIYGYDCDLQVSVEDFPILRQKAKRGILRFLFLLYRRK